MSQEIIENIHALEREKGIEENTIVNALEDALLAAYALVLAALELAPAAPVAAVRETSVVIAVALAGRFLGEPVGPRRLAGAALVVVGVALLGA